MLGSLITWRLEQKRAEDIDQTQQRSARMNRPAVARLATVQVRDISHVFEATGSVEAPLSVSIAPKTTGRVEFIGVNEGDHVKKGQVLVRIDSSQIEANVQEQLAAVAEAQYKLAQAQLTQNSNDISINTQIRQQVSSVKSAKADYDQALRSSEAQIASAKAGVRDAQAEVENAKAGVKSSQANLDNARTKYERTNSLFKKEFVSAQDVDDVKATVAVQEASLEVAQAKQKSAIAQEEEANQELNIADATAKANIEAARAKLVQANASLESARANTAQKTAYRQSISALKASLAAAQASLSNARAQLQDTVLISPLDGYVTKRYIDPGAIASPTQPIISVQFVKQVWVSLPVTEEVCSKIHLGQSAKLTFDTFPGSSFKAKVIQINPSADSENRQFTVRVILSNMNGLLKPGMFAHVSIETDRIHNATVVPREAIENDSNGEYVMTVGTDNKARRFAVTSLAEDEQYVSVGSVLKPGQKVVVMSAIMIKEGQTVITGDHKRKQGGNSPKGAL